LFLVWDLKQGIKRLLFGNLLVHWAQGGWHSCLPLSYCWRTHFGWRMGVLLCSLAPLGSALSLSSLTSGSSYDICQRRLSCINIFISIYKPYILFFFFFNYWNTKCNRQTWSGWMAAYILMITNICDTYLNLFVILI
jgi:hypothetical protein